MELFIASNEWMKYLEEHYGEKIRRCLSDDVRKDWGKCEKLWGKAPDIDRAWLKN